MEPIVVEVRRRGIVEARHVVHSVAVQNGAAVAEAGDAGGTCFLRSSSKPIQALPPAPDGCGVVSFAMPLERMAYAYARFEQLPEGRCVADAMRAHPELVGGPDGPDFDLMRTAPSWFAKGGAEGLLCAGGPDALG